MFIMIGFIVPPFLFAKSIIGDVMVMLADDFSCWNTVQALIALLVTFAFWYVCYHLLINEFFGSTYVYMSTNEVVIDKGNLGIIPIDKIRLKKADITNPHLSKALFGRMQLCIFADGKRIVLAKARPEDDMKHLREIVRTYVNSEEICVLDKYL